MHYIIVSSNARLTVFNVNLTIRTFKIVSDLRKKTPDAGRGLQPRTNLEFLKNKIFRKAVILVAGVLSQN